MYFCLQALFCLFEATLIFWGILQGKGSKLQTTGWMNCEPEEECLKSQSQIE